MPAPASSTRASFRALLEDTRRELLASFEGLDAKQMETPLPNGWSVKDILAHVAMWDEADVADMHRAARGHKTRWGHWTPLVDRWNEVEFALRKEFPLEQVLAELAEARQGLVEFVDGVPEELLASGFIPSACVVQARHDRVHAAQVRNWRDSQAI